MIKKYLALNFFVIVSMLCSCNSTESTITKMNNFKQSRIDVLKQIHSPAFAEKYKITPAEEKLLTKKFVIDTFGKPSYKMGTNTDSVCYCYYYSNELSDKPIATILHIKNGFWERASKNYSMGPPQNIEEFKNDLKDFSKKDADGKAGILTLLNFYVASGLLVISENEIRKLLGEPLFVLNPYGSTWLVYRYELKKRKFLAILYFDVESELYQVSSDIDFEKLKSAIDGEVIK